MGAVAMDWNGNHQFGEAFTRNEFGDYFDGYPAVEEASGSDLPPDNSMNVETFDSSGSEDSAYLVEMDESESPADCKLGTEPTLAVSESMAIASENSMDRVANDSTFGLQSSSQFLNNTRRGFGLRMQSGAKLFQLMEIRSDKQDLSFVEKVILPKEQIGSFSNALVNRSAKALNGEYTFFDFARLNKRTLPVVGFYGSKELMTEYFEKKEIIGAEDQILAEMKEGVLRAGLYAFLKEEFLCVFYWHEGGVLPLASRKEISCNFIRCLVDLCDTVCVFLEAEEVKRLPFSGKKSSLARDQRNRKMVIVKQKATENRVEMSAGFTLRNLNVGKFSLDAPAFRLCQGGRCALLTAKLRSEKNSTRKEKVVGMTEFPSFVEGWKDWKLNFSGIHEGEFSIFLQCSETAEGCTLISFLKSLEQKKSDWQAEQRAALEDLGLAEWQRWEEILEQFLQRYVSIKYAAWEKALSTEEIDRLTEDTSSLRLDDLSAKELAAVHEKPSSGFWSVIPSVIRAPVAAVKSYLSKGGDIHDDQRRRQRTNLNFQYDDLILNQLEQDLWKGSAHMLIFPGSELKVLHVKSKSSKSNEKASFTVYRDPAYSSSVTPVMGWETLHLKPKGQNVETKWEVRFGRAKEKNMYLLTDEELEISTSRGHAAFSRGDKIVLKHLGSSVSGLQSWIGSTAEAIIPGLTAKAALLSFAAEKSQQRIDIWNDDLIHEIVASDDPVGLLEPALKSRSLIDEVANKWRDIHPLNSTLQAEVCASLWRNLPHDIAAVCKDVYKAKYAEVRNLVQHWVKTSSARLRQEKVSNANLRNCEDFEEEQSNEKAAFLRDLRMKLSASENVDTSPRQIHITGCSLQSSTGAPILEDYDAGVNVANWISTSELHHPTNVFVAVKFVVEEADKIQSICWDALEIAPMKDDLGKLVTDPNHRFTPSFSQGHNLLTLDPNTERLVKTVFLKSGQLLVFLVTFEDGMDKELNILLSPKLGAGWQKIRTMKRGIDLVAFDETSKFLALYERSMSVIKTYRFDDAFRNLDWTGADANLSELGDSKVVWMDFVAGRKEIVFVDEVHKVRVFEMVTPFMVKPKTIDLGPEPFVKACVASQGPCLLVFRGSNQNVQTLKAPTIDDVKLAKQLVEPLSVDGSVNASPMTDEDPPRLELYFVDDTMSHVTTISLTDIGTSDVSKIQATIVEFETQVHLILHNSDCPGTIVSKVLKIASASEFFSLNKIAKPTRSLEESSSTGSNSNPGSGSSLDYVYHIFDKYSTDPPLVKEPRDLCLRMVFKGSAGIGEEFLKYFNSLIHRLEIEKGKKFGILNFRGEVSQFGSDFPIDESVIPMGKWLRRLLCLVPIQIARAENNGLKPLVDGLELRDDVDYADAVSLANVIRFGLYDAVLASWTGPVKVISSMGKQSSGKSYLLNHLSGSLLDVSGGRCTDGVWMTVRIVDDCLYVLLDFEGLGSFERSEQEDMLLSVLNAAISNITIFNKKDFHLDKETEAVFERFQSGINLVKKDEKLFQGKFYMAIKDVDNSDVDDLQEEFERKIQQMLSKASDNFLTEMYGGSVEIGAMASFNRPEYYESIEDIGFTVEELESSYKNGGSFSVDLKLVISQLCAKDWSPIDLKRVSLKISLIRKYLSSAVKLGCLPSSAEGGPELIHFDTQEQVADEPIQLDKTNDPDVFSVEDGGLELAPFHERTEVSDILTRIKLDFESMIERRGSNDEEWHSSLGFFIEKLAERRKERVLQWVSWNLEGLPESDGDIQKLNLEVKALLAEVKQDLSLCNCTCELCFLKCTRERGHSASHSCLGVGSGDHTCTESCTYCIECEGGEMTDKCADLAGHQGPHDCKMKSHTCTQACIYAEKAGNCNKKCSLQVGHSEEHKCNSKEHLCKQRCSLAHCNNPCVSPFVVDHEKHACHEKSCPEKCPMPGCNRTCAWQDHFHSLTPNPVHLCGNEHSCQRECEAEGICEVLAEMIKVQKVFYGKRHTFSYEHVTEQNGKRKDCSVLIPPFREEHDGPHMHTLTPNAVHFCSVRCPACGYFCNLATGHDGLHNTTHGNMRHAIFSSDTEEIDVGGRSYAWGESGVAEMCNMHCKAQGRGHTHLELCPRNGDDQTGACLSLLLDGTRHQTQKYGPNFDVPKDEMTHAAYWKHIRFVDPCSVAEQQEFELCNFQCMSEDHKVSDPNKGTESEQRKISFCTEKLWHDSLDTRTDGARFPTGYITENGHHLSCEHTKMFEPIHAIFIVDMSLSMTSKDIVPQLEIFKKKHNNRIGCVLEAILYFIRTRIALVNDALVQDEMSVIRFAANGQVAVDRHFMDESIVNKLAVDLNQDLSWSGRTSYWGALSSAKEPLEKSIKKPVIIFLSDGADNGGQDPMQEIRMLQKVHSEMVLHTVVFGRDENVSTALLLKMAEAGGGKFHVSLDHLQLVRTFVLLAKKPAVAALVHDRLLPLARPPPR